MTDETTPDAVEMLQRMHACVVLSENHGDVPRVSSDEVLAALRAVQAERARHAEEVAALQGAHKEAIAYAQRVRRERDAAMISGSKAEERALDRDSLRDQFRKVEGERDDARAQVAEVQHEHDALLQRADQAERELGAWQDWALTHCDPGDGSDDRHLRELVGSQLASLRSLLPDVWACAEYLVEPVSCLPSGLRQSARNILAALDSQGGEGE